MLLNTSMDSLKSFYHRMAWLLMTSSNFSQGLPSIFSELPLGKLLSFCFLLPVIPSGFPHILTTTIGQWNSYSRHKFLHYVRGNLFFLPCYNLIDILFQNYCDLRFWSSKSAICDLIFLRNEVVPLWQSLHGGRIYMKTGHRLDILRVWSI